MPKALPPSQAASLHGFRNGKYDPAHPVTVNYPSDSMYGGDDGARTRDLCRDRKEVCWEFQVAVKPACRKIDFEHPFIA